jgi:hypothetical protein
MKVATRIVGSSHLDCPVTGAIADFVAVITMLSFAD